MDRTNENSAEEVEEGKKSGDKYLFMRRSRMAGTPHIDLANYLSLRLGECLLPIACGFKSIDTNMLVWPTDLPWNVCAVMLSVPCAAAMRNSTDFLSKRYFKFKSVVYTCCRLLRYKYNKYLRSQQGRFGCILYVIHNNDTNDMPKQAKRTS